MSTIPANELVNVVPSVLGAGGSALEIIGLMLTNSTRIPIGTVQSFPDAASVVAFFGAGSLEARKAGVYFAGFDGANRLPASLLLAQYNSVAVAAYLRGGNVSALTLAQLRAINGSLTVTMDGYPRTGAVDLSAAASFSSAAGIIEDALNGTLPEESEFTASVGASFTATQTGTSMAVTAVTGKLHPGDVVAGTGVATGTKIVSQSSGPIGGAGTYITDLSGTAASAACTSTSNVLEVTAVASGDIAVGQTVTGAGFNDAVITALGTGTGGVGNYTLDGAQQSVASQTFNSEGTPVTVSYDSVSGAFTVLSGITGAPSAAAFAAAGSVASALKFTQATGAVTSQGASAAAPGAFMDALTLVSTNFVTYMTLFNPDGETGESIQKQAFAAWKNTKGQRYAYVCWDSDPLPTTQLPATSSLGDILATNGDSGTCLIWEDADHDIAAFICGAAASIDFTQTNGRINFAYKGQAGLVASVSNALIANNLGGAPQGATRGNNYNFYGAYAPGAEAQAAAFVWFQRGFVTGPFSWFDAYINQIWLNSQFQIALLNLLKNSKSIPYGDTGSALIEQTLLDPINAGLNFGAFGPGPISASQAASVNQAAGADVASTLQTQGWYLQVKTASAAVRAARTSPPCTFRYLDGGSVQAINIASVALQ